MRNLTFVSPTLCAVDLMPASAIFPANALNLEEVALLECLQTTSKAEKICDLVVTD